MCYILKLVSLKSNWLESCFFMLSFRWKKFPWAFFKAQVIMSERFCRRDVLTELNQSNDLVVRPAKFIEIKQMRRGSTPTSMFSLLPGRFWFNFALLNSVDRNEGETRFGEFARDRCEASEQFTRQRHFIPGSKITEEFQYGEGLLQLAL